MKLYEKPCLRRRKDKNEYEGEKDVLLFMFCCLKFSLVTFRLHQREEGIKDKINNTLWTVKSACIYTSVSKL